MSTPSAPAAPPRTSNSFSTLVAVGVLVVAAGLILPRLLSLSPVPASADVGDGAEPPGSPFQSVRDQSPTSPPAPEKTTPSSVTPAAPASPAVPGETASLVWVVAKLMFGLAIVTGVCIGVARWANRTRQTAPPGILAPLAKLAVDPRCVVHLIGAGHRRLLVGTDATGAKVVLELPPK